MHARLRGPNNLLILHQIINRTWYPFLADEIAEPRPDRNIKVASFTVSDKSINSCLISSFHASGNFCHLLITFANSLEPEQDWHNVGSGLVPNGLTLWECSWKKLFKHLISADDKRNTWNITHHAKG